MDIYRFNQKNVIWHVPCLFNNDRIAIKLLHIMKLLNMDKPFDIVYGACQCSLSAGRNSIIQERLTYEQIEEYFKSYDQYDVKCYLTFSKVNIETKDLHDTYSNMFLTLANKYHGGVIIANDTLYTYIRNNYPNIKIVASVIKATFDTYEDELQYYHDLLNRYDYVVIRPEFALDLDKVKMLSDKERVELLINQSCMANCPYAKSHYLHYEKNSSFAYKVPCLQEKSKLAIINHSLLLANSYTDKLLAMGFKHLKLQGRNIYPDELLECFGTYIFDNSGIYQQLKKVILNDYGYESYELHNLDKYFDKIMQDIDIRKEG